VIVDDELLAKEGMGDRLTHPELLEALWERGMYVHLMQFGHPGWLHHSQYDRRLKQNYAEIPSSLVAHHGW
jgi:hypothetical protein